MASSVPVPRAVLMIKPRAFGFNRETAASNAFQRDDRAPDRQRIARLARAEHDMLAAALRARGVRVVVIEDTIEPAQPDTVFPNNWLSLHRSGDAIVYPMLAPGRQAEVRLDLLEVLAAEHDLRWPRLHDLRDPRLLGGVLEGTGSLVLDRVAGVAYACLSPRTDAHAVHAFCRRFDYEPVVFRATDPAGGPVYHTNVLLTLGRRFAVACLEAVDDPAERRGLVSALEAHGREIVSITQRQMARFAGNMLELENEQGERLLVASAAACIALGETRRARLAEHASFVTSPLPTIERYGGGSARCMLVELDVRPGS